MAGLPSGAGALVGKRLGKYEILALLALGGTAEIYLARIDGTAGFEKYVVVKCLHDHLAEDSDFVSMFLDEARLGAALDHSNIVQTLALGEHDNRYYMVMEYIAGLSLALVGRRAHERVRGGKVPVHLVLNMAAQACGGLHYAHERTEGGQPLNLVHRDISPQNLVITYEGIVKVVDFGIAKAEYRETRTRSGTVKGKFAYMSPEQCQAGDVDRRTDVFALGVIMWELLTGRRLFKRDSTYETYQAVVECSVPQLSSINHELDPALDGIIMPAMAKDRHARYPTAEAFGEALMKYMHQRGKPSGAGEVSRFFEECFTQEIDEQGARMRELIQGQKKSIADQKLLQWDSSELDGSASVLELDDLDAVVDESVSAAKPSRPAPAPGKVVGAVSPPMASARAMTTPERPVRTHAPTVPQGRSGRPTQPPPAPTLRRPTGPPVRAVAEPLAPPPSAMEPPTLDVAIDPSTLDRALEPSTLDQSVSSEEPEDEFETDPLTDAEAWRHEVEDPGGATRVEANPLEAMAALDARSGRRPSTAGDYGASTNRAATAPPRKGGPVLTPPGMRAGGAPLDPLPHEREAIPIPAPKPSGARVPPAPGSAGPSASAGLKLFGTKGASAGPTAAVIPTVIAGIAPENRRSRAPTQPQPIQQVPPPRFADAPTAIHDARPQVSAPLGTPAGARKFNDAPTAIVDAGPAASNRRSFANAPAQMPTVVADARMPEGGAALARGPGRSQVSSDPPSGQTQMLAPGDLVEVNAGADQPTQPDLSVQSYQMPGAPQQQAYPHSDPAQMVSLPQIGDVYPGHPYYGQNQVPSGPRNWPPWVLGVMFFVVLALATGITVAIARAVS